MSSLLSRLARFCYRQRRLVIVIWVVSTIGLHLLAGALGATPSEEFSIPGAEAQKGVDILTGTFPSKAGLSTQVVFEGENVTENASVQQVISEFENIEGVTDVTPPSGETGSVSPDGTVAYATVITEETVEEVETFHALEKVTAPVENAEVSFGGGLAVYGGEREAGSETIGLMAAAIVLLITFGSIVAAGLPLITALFGIGVGLGVVSLVSVFADIPEVATILGTMIGIGVGIDYALFIVTRHRQHLAEGMDVETSVIRSAATAGSAVVFAGVTVVIAICGLVAAGVPFITGMGLGAAGVVAVAVIGATTLLPALLGFTGQNVNKLRIPGIKSSQSTTTGPWARWAKHVGSHPWPYMITSIVFLLLLAAPTLAMRIGQTDAGNNAPGSTTRIAYDTLARGFGPGSNGPLTLVIQPNNLDGTEQSFEELTSSLSEDPDVAVVTPPVPGPDGETFLITVVPKSSPQSAETAELLDRVRNNIIPSTPLAEQVYVTGATAFAEDISDRISQRLPYFMFAVIGLSFLVLMAAFRSVLVPLKAAIMNLLSIGAAYGVVVAIFQWGWGKELIGLEETVPIVSFIPMFMFAILFGLSMDYEVFLLSRVREEYASGKTNNQAVEAGLSATARVITSAALIMITVFGAFAFEPDPIIKMMGIGLATAIFVDATIVRTIVVPSTMALLGDANWWLPKWLDRILPEIHLEGEEPAAIETNEPNTETLVD